MSISDKDIEIQFTVQPEKGKRLRKAPKALQDTFRNAATAIRDGCLEGKDSRNALSALKKSFRWAISILE